MKKKLKNNKEAPLSASTRYKVLSTKKGFFYAKL